MDIVITYVNGLDPEWLKDYAHFTNVPVVEKRFRDWGTLPYLFRGIERNMPYINNVFLVVSRESQVPEWVNRDKVKVVLHKDFVPSVFLPTFNCNPLEMYLHRIPGLSEEYLYFNDDMYPLLPTEPEDFFENGCGKIHFSRHFFTGNNMYKQICKNSHNAARMALGLKPTPYFIRPQHICSPMLKSECEEVFYKMEDDIRNLISITRTGGNHNQYLFLDYMYYKGKIKDEKISNKHFSVALATPEKLRKFILSPTRKMACINDVHLSENRYEEMRRAILEAFEIRFPEKSKYEI